MKIEEYIENRNSERIIEEIFVFPKSKSARIKLENGKTETVPSYIWSLKKRGVGDVMEMWQQIQSYSTSDFIPRITFCGICAANIPSPGAGGPNWENENHNLVCGVCETVLGRRYFIDSLTMTPYYDYNMTEKVLEEKPWRFGVVAFGCEKTCLQKWLEERRGEEELKLS